MRDIQKITIIGAGCVGDFLATELHKSGYQIVEIVSRRIKPAQEIARKVKALANKDDFTKMNQESDLYILSVKDEVILELRKFINVGEKLIVHTSGSVTIDVFKKCSANYGLLYPLQTIIRERIIDIHTVPFFIEGNNPETLLRLEQFARTFSDLVYQVDEKKRIQLHMAAIFASNFTNYLYKIAGDILIKENIPFDVLKPLATETIHKIFELGPIVSQTGPARRGDCTILDKHKSLLKYDKKKLYSLLSNMIKKDFKNVRRK